MLFPRRLPVTFRRLPPAPLHSAWVQWWWFSQWNLPDGEVSRQDVIAFPVANLVVEPDAVTLTGPPTRASHRDLSGDGWALAALLQPAANPVLCGDVARCVDAVLTLSEASLVGDLGRQVGSGKAEDAIETFGRWIENRCGRPSDEQLLANRMSHLVATRPEILTVGDIARATHQSERSVHRLSHKYLGLTPGDLVRRRRIQEAAAQVRSQQHTPLAEVAVAHGFTDQAHLTREFRRLLCRTPAAYRAETADRS